MLQKLKKNPLLTASLIVFFYALWFVVPMFFREVDPNAKGISGISGALTMWSAELATAIMLALALSLLGWWRKIGFCSIKKGSFKFLLPIFFTALFILNIAWVFDESGKWLFGFDSPLQLFSLLGMTLLLGFVEEGIFRGVLFYGLSKKFTPLFTVIFSAVIFAIFHFVNLFEGASFNTTFFQAIHAGAMGFLYASLRLRLGALWPLMLLHGFWDFSIFVLQSSRPVGMSGDISTAQGLSIALPALLYGIFVYWRWSKQTNI